MIQLPHIGKKLGQPAKPLLLKQGQTQDRGNKNTLTEAVLDAYGPKSYKRTGLLDRSTVNNNDDDGGDENPRRFNKYDKNPKSYKRSKASKRSPNGSSDSNGRGEGGGGSYSNSNSQESYNYSGRSTRGYHTSAGVSCILWKSGITSGLTVNTRIVAKDYTPLYLSSGYLFIVTDNNIDNYTEFDNQLNNIIYPQLEILMSSKINRFIGRYVNAKDFNDYVYAIVTALQVYYCIDSVITYCSNLDSENINVGMERLRSHLTSEALTEFNYLREFLINCSCPTNLLDYIRFMCQTFRSSNAPHSSILKLNIGGLFEEDWNISTGDYIVNVLIDCRQNLTACNKMNSYLNQTVPEWKLNSLPSSSALACYNESFITFWHNQNCSYLCTENTSLGVFKYTKIVDNMDSYTDYQIIQRDSDVDGVIFISNSYNIKVSGKDKLSTYWGIWQPLATIKGKQMLVGNTSNTFNIKCFDSNGTISVALDSTVLSSSCIRHLVQYDGVSGNNQATLIKFGNHGFIKLQNSSIRMQTEAFNNTMRYWFL